MARNFMQLYDLTFKDEIVDQKTGSVRLKNGDPLLKAKYGRRKWIILRKMTKIQLLEDFQDFGLKLNMTKEQMLSILRKNSWKI
jgi:hypothetical protein